jgi:hypothetical protein
MRRLRTLDGMRSPHGEAPDAETEMAEFIASGRVVDLILGVIALEACVLLAWRHAWGGRLAALDLVLMLLPGALLLLALRGALLQTSWTWIVLCVALAFPVHLADVGRRWQTIKP